MSDITRRDFINGTLMAAGSTLLPLDAASEETLAALSPDYYPPRRHGLRGSHPGSNEAAHARAWAGQSDWGSVSNLSETYDLVVVGGGLSGLAAAYFFQKKHGADKKVLVLDNHDDFGGHAKRNEHLVNGQLLLGEGGSESLEYPHGWGEVPLSVMSDLGVDMDRFKSAYDEDFFKRHGLGAATFFNERVFGENKVVRHPFCDYPGFVQGLMRPKLSYEEAVAQTPLSATGKEQLLRILNGGQHELNVPQDELQDYAGSNSWFDYLQNTLGVDDPLVLRMARHTAIDYAGSGTDVMSIYGAVASGCIGGDPYDAWPNVLEPGDYQEYVDKGGETYTVRYPFIEHFPDGNATIARALVKRLVPKVGPGESAEEIIMSKFNYAELDNPSNSARIRLNSTAINVTHEGDPENSDVVAVTYINGRSAYRVRCKGVVMAGYNMMIPHIVSDLPEDQDAALRKLSKVPLQYTTIGVTNWRAMHELGIGMAMCPGNIHQVVGMDYPTSMGGYEYTKSPDDPCILHLRSCQTGKTIGAPALDQYKEVRERMLSMQFSDYEAELREHLGGMFPEELFDFDRDVKSISINRWGHAYSIGNPGPIGRRPFGRITIANSDATDSSLMNNAIQQAFRAVEELG